MSAWLSKNSNGLLGLLGLLVFVVGIDFAPPWLGDKIETLIGRIAADPNGTTAVFLVVVGAIATAIGMLRAAWQRDPNATAKPQRVSRTDGFARLLSLVYVVAAGLALAAGCSLLSGCTAAQQQQATTVGRDVLAWTCAPAKKICEMFASSTEFGVSACTAIETACDIGGVMLNSAPAPVVDEQPHHLSTDPGVPVSCVEPLRHHTPLVCQVLDRRPLRDHARVRT